MLLEACRFGGNDESVAALLRQFQFEKSVLQQALVTLEAGSPAVADESTGKTTKRLKRRLKA